MTIIKTTINPAKVVIIACSSRPERIRSWFKTATIMPIAAILKIKSMFILGFFPSVVSSQQDSGRYSSENSQHLIQSCLCFLILSGLLKLRLEKFF